MVALARGLAYATLFVGLLLIWLPARVLEWSGVGRPANLGLAQFAGATIGVLGGALALWCVLTFALAGRGTPAPFDPPRSGAVTQARGSQDMGERTG